MIVGRGGQCVLQERPDEFHVFVYAPLGQRIARIQRRVPAARDAEDLIASTDRQRAEHVRLNFGCEWNNPHLYHMLVCSSLGEDAVATLAIAGMGQSRADRA